MPNLNEYYQLLQKEEPPLSNNALREMLASAMERADKEALDEALAAPQATASIRRSRLHGTGIVAGAAAIITLSFWGFTYFQSQQSSAPRVHQETVQSGKNEVGTVGNTTTTEENTSRSTDTQYNAQQTDQFLQPPFAAISHTTRPQTNSGVTTTVADTITKNNTTQTEPYPADSLLPEDFRSWEMPSYLAWAVAQRRYGTARTIIDSMLHNGQHSVQSEYNLYCLRGHLSKAMDSVEASITDYSQALSFQESSALYMQRGTQYFTASKRQEAYDDFTTAMRLDPKNYQAVYMRGAAAYNLKRFEEACDDWSLAAQMGHPLADSVMAAKCAGYVPRYTRTAMAEAKQRITNTVLLLNTLQNKLQSTRTPFPKDHMPQLDSLSYRAFGSSCNTNNVTDNTISPFCMVHLLYSLALELHDLVAIDFAQKIWTRMAAATSPFDRTKNGQNMYNRIDRTDYNEIIVKEVANGGSTDKIRSLQSKQAMQSAIRATQEAHQMNSPSGISPTQYQDIVQLLQQMQKYYHVQYAEFLDSK